MEIARLEKRFDVPVHPRLRAQVGIAEDKAEPFLELGPEARLAAVDGRSCRCVLGLRIPRRNSPEPKKLIASTRTA